jgi:CubicO group peptidase (beta-lactamase class C family)
MTRADGSEFTVGDVLADSYTDAYVVVQDGAVVAEWYGPEGAPDRTHALMSITKSVIGCVAAVLIDRGSLETDQLVTHYVPELATSGYAGATVRNVVDMRSGVRFREDYLDPGSEVRVLGDWIFAVPSPDDPKPRGVYRFLTELAAEAPHGQRFLYRSAESDVLGWVCERAGGRPMPELISTLIWQPMGAEHDAEILCDGLGASVHDGGLCATARDVARFGQLLLDSDSVVPSNWIRQAWAVDADARSAFAASPAESSMPGGWYRNQFWFVPGRLGDVLLCLGINGQMLYVSRRTGTVCVKLSSWPAPQEPELLQATLWAFDAVAGALTGRSVTAGRHRLPGVVSGASRHRSADRAQS